MKLGSIVGIVCSCILIIAGIVLCNIGASIADDNDQTLLTQKDKDGTYYCQKISDEITRIDLDLDHVSVTVSEGAEEPCIEFYNFNPINYALTATTNVISFEETPEVKKLTDILDNGINFKGLRYTLDPANYSGKNGEKRVVVNLSEGLDVKILDLSAIRGSVDISSVDSECDISISLKKGDINLSDIKTTSTIELFCGECDTDITGVSALSFKYKADKSDLSVKSCTFADSQITVNKGDVTYTVSEDTTEMYIEAVSEHGNIIANGIVTQSPYKNDIKEYDVSLKIKSDSAGINITHPVTEATVDTEALDENE